MVPRGFQRLAGQMPDALHVTNRGQRLLAGSPLVPSPFFTGFFLHAAAAIASFSGLRRLSGFFARRRRISAGRIVHAILHLSAAGR